MDMKRLLIGTVLAAGMIVTGVQAVGAGQERPTPPQTYEVQAGDSLWTVAGRMAPDRDRRAVVHELMEANGLPSTTLLPGQILELPPR